MSDWISKSGVSRLLGVSRHAVDRLIREGRFTILDVPGSHIRVSRAEVAELARNCTVATAASA